MSSISDVGELSDLVDDSDDDADDEEDQQVVPVPSHGRRRSKSQKKGIRYSRQMADDADFDHYDSDSDDAYAAVDDITDGDDEDQNVEKLEELLILESEDDHLGSVLNTPSITGSGDLAGPGLFDNDLLIPNANFFDEEQLYAAMETFGESDATSDAAVETPVPRRVHFQESDSSSSDSDSLTDDEIPGDFLQQDSLDPQLRRMIESDNENQTRHSRRSDDVFGESDYGHANIYHAESDADSYGSSGYETDDGETTDEDLPPPATITHPRSILRRDSSASLAPADDEDKRPPLRRRGPIMGTFIADPNKPVALVDSSGKHLVIIPAFASSRHDWLESATNSVCGTASNSPRAPTMPLMDESDTDALATPTQTELSPMLSSGANLMMAALGNDTAPGGQVMGPPEAFYPSRDLTFDSSFDEDDDDDPEASLNVEDFIDFGDGSSDEEMDDVLASPMVTSSAQGAGAGTPTPTRNADLHQASSAERFLNHLDRGIVTAFRRNHNRYQALLRLPHHREFMPANSPSRPASVFRHARHADPRTPIRKRRHGGYAGGEAIRRKLMDTPQPHRLC